MSMESNILDFIVEMLILHGVSGKLFVIAKSNGDTVYYLYFKQT